MKRTILKVFLQDSNLMHVLEFVDRVCGHEVVSRFVQLIEPNHPQHEGIPLDPRYWPLSRPGSLSK